MNSTEFKITFALCDNVVNVLINGKLLDPQDYEYHYNPDTNSSILRLKDTWNQKKVSLSLKNLSAVLSADLAAKTGFTIFNIVKDVATAQDDMVKNDQS